jgi:hypothetical protein
MCNGKASPTYVPASEHHVEEFAGMKLTEEEVVTAATACNLVNKYLAGQLPPDAWDRGIRRKSRKTDAHAVIAAARELAQPAGHITKQITCNSCMGQGRISKPPAQGLARIRRIFQRSTLVCPVCMGAKQLVMVMPQFPSLQAAMADAMGEPEAGAVTVEVTPPPAA